MGPENRDNVVCDLHAGFHETMNRIEGKLDEMATRQISYMEKQIKLESIVTNGLSSNVAAMMRPVTMGVIQSLLLLRLRLQAAVRLVVE